MKKIFTLVVMAAMAIGANAQTISFSETASAGTLDSKTFGTGFVLTCTDTKGKMSIDANSQYFGTADSQEQFNYRIKTGGATSSNRALTLTIPSNGILYVYARSANATATDRAVVLTRNNTELYNSVVKDEDAVKATINETETNVFPVISISVDAGSVDVGTTGGINFYAFKLVTSTGVEETIAPNELKDAPAYNLAGQRVNSDAKGIVIQNGKKSVRK